MCKKSINSSQPFVKKMKNVRTPQGGIFLTHTVHMYMCISTNGNVKFSLECLSLGIVVIVDIPTP